MKVQQVIIPDIKKIIYIYIKRGAKEYESPLIDENSKRQGRVCYYLREGLG